MESNIKPDRTDLDLMFGCLLELGLPLSMPFKSESKKDFHIYNSGAIITCFNEIIFDDIIKEIAERHPECVIFRDSGFTDSLKKINVNEIFKIISPETKIKII